jgi:hypothetical protein
MLNDPYHMPTIREQMTAIIDNNPGLSREELNRIRDQLQRELTYPSPALASRQIQSVVWRQEHR